MAAASASPMASQLKSSLLSSPTTTRGLLTPKGLSGSQLRNLQPKTRPILTVRAIQAAAYFPSGPAHQRRPIHRQPRDPGYIRSTHRMVLSNGLPHRGIEVGLAHGFLLVGPFVKASPLCNTPYAGSLAAGGLVVILSICLTMYGIASFKEGEPSTAPSLTGRKKEADKLQTADGRAQFSGGFFFRGISGVFWAYFLLYVLNLPYFVK